MDNVIELATATLTGVHVVYIDYDTARQLAALLTAEATGITVPGLLVP